MENRLLSVVQVAELLGVSRIQVVRLIHTGKIAAQKVGRSYVIDAAVLEDNLINRPVDRVVREYRETLTKLSDE